MLKLTLHNISRESSKENVTALKKMKVNETELGFNA